MTDKKDPGKFTIRFNICDPQHKAVIDLLNRKAASKAQFLVSAVPALYQLQETQRYLFRFQIRRHWRR